MVKAPNEPNLPTRFTVKNYVLELAKNRSSLLRSKLNGIFEFCTGALAIDFGERVHDYLVAIWHSLLIKEEKVSMFESIIAFEEVTGDKNSDIIWNKLLLSAEVAGFNEPMLRKMTGLSDEGSNIVSCVVQNMKIS